MRAVCTMSNFVGVFLSCECVCCFVLWMCMLRWWDGIYQCDLEYTTGWMCTNKLITSHTRTLDHTNFWVSIKTKHVSRTSHGHTVSTSAVDQLDHLRLCVCIVRTIFEALCGTLRCDKRGLGNLPSPCFTYPLLRVSRIAPLFCSNRTPNILFHLCGGAS
jgi:hypothetical protein